MRLTTSSALSSLLTREEEKRAERFRFEHLKNAFILAHGALRHLLGRYLDLAPGKIRLAYGPKRKPGLDGGGLEFNLTHSGALAAIALTAGCPLGLDTQHIRPLPDMAHIARRFFCAEEESEILMSSESLRARAFFCCWTRKEAYIKAMSDGLSVPLDSFRVSVDPASPARMPHIAGDPFAAREWTLHDLRLAPGYAAALAYRGRPRPLSLFSIGDARELIGSG